MSGLADALHQSVTEQVAPIRGACAGRLVAGGELHGCPVVNPRGDVLGEVVAVLLDLRPGRIAAVVMASGGFLGVGQRRYALPWPALTLDEGRNALVIEAQRETFDQAPVFDDERWAEQSAAPAWHDQLQRHWGVGPRGPEGVRT